LYRPDKADNQIAPNGELYDLN